MIKFLKKYIGNRSPLRLGWHQSKALIAALKYRFPARKLTVIGVTGTDGKTTTAGMIAHILKKNGIRAGAASTAFVQIEDEVEENSTHLTSISPFVLQKFLRKLVKRGCTHAVVEMSSHGLVQGRSSWTFPSIATITNISLEHLDYHGSMKQYIKDKAILLRMLSKNGTKVLNASDESFGYFSSILKGKTISISDTEEAANIQAKEIKASDTKCTALINANDEDINLSIPIPGLFNIQNALCAIGCTKACGINIEDSTNALSDFSSIPGRMEMIDEGQPFSVFVDFAVSPNAYEKTLNTLRQIVGGNGRVMVLCSSCGDRMKEKRPIVGQICSDLADFVVATEDETYGEDPHSVLDEVWNGIDQSKCEAYKIFDRSEAISFLFENAKEGDAVVLCGMGPFSTMNKIGGAVDWDEREVAKAKLSAMSF